MSELHGQRADCTVIGAGAVGLAVARAIALTGREVLVLESARAIGTGTSSRNSEVIHAGIYYPTGSLKARLCVAGKHALYQFCAEHGVAHRRMGKIIVAVTPDEVSGLDKLRRKAANNGVHDLRALSAADVRALEPDIVAAGGLFSPSTGIIDSHAFMLAMQADLESAGGLVVLNSPVTGIAVDGRGFRVRAADTELRSDTVVNAAGLHAIAVARSIDGLRPELVPSGYLAKGHYYMLTGKSPFGRLIYPLPSPGGLGIHVTIDLAAAARFGPDVRWIETEDYSFDESRREAFVAAIRRYYPALDDTRLQPAYTGIRPRLVGPGEPAADFLLQGPAEHGVAGLVNLFGIESPGLTAALAIGDRVAALLRC